MHDETPERRPRPPKAEPTQTEAELSRIAREAVHQPADARLDKQLVRLGLLDASEVADLHTAEPRPASIDPELVRTREDLRRTRALVWLLVGVVAVLAVVIVVLLVR